MTAPVGLGLLYLSLMTACTPLRMLSGGFEKPKVTIKDVTLLETTGLSSKFSVRLAVLNKNSYDLEVVSLDYLASLAGKKMAEGVWKDGATLKAGQEILVTLPLSVELANTGQILGALLGRKALALNYTGKLVVSGGFWGNLDFPFDEKHEIKF